MIKYYKKIFFRQSLVVFLLLNFFLIALTPLTALGQQETPSGEHYGLTKTVGVAKDLNTGTDLSTIAGKFINYVLGIVGTIFLLVILVGGYKWMSSGGNEEKIAAGKKMIIAGLNGMIAIFLAYALAYAIIAGLKAATGT